MARKTTKILALLSTSGLCIVAASQAHAQSAQAAPQPAAAEAPSGLQEIIVTAQKRSENLQNVPVTVTAVSAADLSASNIKSARELTTAVPGLIYSQAGGTTQTFLRGIGTTITAVNADPSVATYIDGVYQSLAAVSSVKLSDIQAVEVLKGPQGTLYGRNSTGGAISITTRSPTDRFEGSATATYASFDRREVGGSLSGPVAKHLYLGVYANYEARDPYSKLENLTGLPRPNVRDHDFQWTARSKLVYDGDNNLRVVLSGDITKYGSLQDMAYQQLQTDAEAYGNGTVGPRAVRSTKHYSFSTNIPADNRWTSKGASLRVEYDLAKVKFVSITAYRDNSAFLRSDSDATDAAVPISDTSLTNLSKQTTQEFQLQSTGSGSLKWIVGGFYYRDEGRLDPLQITPPTLNQSIVAGVNTTSYSGYGQLDWSISPRWSATLGGRYTDETKDYTGGVVTAAFPPAAPTRTILAPRTVHYSQFDPKVSLQYHLGDAMVYGSYSQAFKSGVYNITGTSAAATSPVNPEKLKAYEFGVKSEFFERRLRVNAAYFHYDFKDLQVQTFSGTTLALQNAAQASFDGVDIDALLAVTSRFQLSAKMLIEDGKYDLFPAYNGKVPRNTARGGNTDASINLTGRRPVRTPKFTGTFGATYKQPLSNGAQLALNGLVYHSSEFSFVPDGSLRSAPYTTADVSIEYTSPTGLWTASIWARNLTDKFYFNYKQINNQGSYGIPAPPRTIGATVSLKLDRL